MARHDAWPEQVRTSAARKVNMQIGSLELQVLVNDRPVREYGHQGRTYVAGHKGSRFTLKLRNNTAQRVLAIPSIDGLCACDGQPATAASKGYIVAAYATVEIKGWKQSLSETADFVFTDKGTSSYAAQTHGAQNCGVIAVKVVAERYTPPPPPPTQVIIREEHHHYPPPQYPHWHPWPTIVYASCSTGNVGAASSGLGSAPSTAQYTCDLGNAVSNSLSLGPTVSAMFSEVAAAMPLADSTPDFTLGTGYGQVRQDVVTEAIFERGLELATFEIYYSDEAALSAVGVPLNKSAQISKPVPQAFNGFCRPPSVSV